MEPPPGDPPEDEEECDEGDADVREHEEDEGVDVNVSPAVVGEVWVLELRFVDPARGHGCVASIPYTVNGFFLTDRKTHTLPQMIQMAVKALWKMSTKTNMKLSYTVETPSMPPPRTQLFQQGSLSILWISLRKHTSRMSIDETAEMIFNKELMKPDLFRDLLLPPRNTGSSGSAGQSSRLRSPFLMSSMATTLTTRKSSSFSTIFFR